MRIHKNHWLVNKREVLSRSRLGISVILLIAFLLFLVVLTIMGDGKNPTGSNSTPRSETEAQNIGSLPELKVENDEGLSSPSQLPSLQGSSARSGATQGSQGLQTLQDSPAPQGPAGGLRDLQDSENSLQQASLGPKNE